MDLIVQRYAKYRNHMEYQKGIVNTHKAIFLLGGHDLEMLEIRRMLSSHSLAYEDRNLNWSNARLSAYSDFINDHPHSCYYGIELMEDCQVPSHYVRIDHHNDFSNRPASILQVAELLNVIPDRYLQLVAANDAGYIPAMLGVGADDDEVQEIRRKDRAAQGVTEQDELLAEKSIAEGLMELQSILIVHSYTARFSTICDRLYPYHRLLIYTDQEWTYYGAGKSELVATFNTDIRAGRVYHGGGQNGYIGAAKNAFSKEQIESVVDQIKREYEYI